MVVSVVDPASIDRGEGPLAIGSILGAVGFISGVAFGALMSIAESRKKVLQLSLLRVAL